MLTLLDDPQNIHTGRRSDITKVVLNEYRPQPDTPVLVDSWWRQVVPSSWTLLRCHQCVNVCSWTWSPAWYSVCTVWRIFSVIKSLVWSWTPQEEGCSQRNKGADLLHVPHRILPYRFFFWSLDSIVVIVTRYDLDGPGIESRWGRGFRTCPDRLWGTPRHLYNGYRVFPGGKEARVWRWPSTPSTAEVKERVEL